jgi:hypothetical protein
MASAGRPGVALHDPARHPVPASPADVSHHGVGERGADPDPNE